MNYLRAYDSDTYLRKHTRVKYQVMLMMMVMMMLRCLVESGPGKGRECVFPFKWAFNGKVSDSL